MPRTPEQRAAANRDNARKSTGPTSDEGKRRSRRNAIKHGMRSVLPMPDEDPAVVDARERAWDAYYQPGSPAAEHLVRQCVRATVMADRVQKHLDAVVAQQVREATQRWDNARLDEVNALFDRMPEDPAASVRDLKRTSDGCLALMKRWEQLDNDLRTSGYWTGSQIRLAVHLQGWAAEGDALKSCPGAWLTLLYGYVVHPGDTTRAEDHLFRVDRRPEAFARAESPVGVPEPDRARELLLDMIDVEMSALDAEFERLEAEIDGPARASAVGQAYLPQDPNVARLSLRYQSESRLAFHRAFDSLVKTLKQDEAQSEAADTEKDVPVDGTSHAASEATQPPLPIPSTPEPASQPAPERTHFENDSPQEVEKVVEPDGENTRPEACETRTGSTGCDRDDGAGSHGHEGLKVASDGDRAGVASRRRQSGRRGKSAAREAGSPVGTDPSADPGPGASGSGDESRRLEPSELVPGLSIS